MFFARHTDHIRNGRGYSARIRSMRDGAQWSAPVFSDDLLAALRYVAELALWVGTQDEGQWTSEMVEVQVLDYRQSNVSNLWTERVELQGTMQVAQVSVPSGLQTMAVADNGDVLVEWTS